MASKCQSHKLANLFGILLVAVLAVHTFWSSNTGAMAVRDLPFEFEVFEQILLPDLTIKSCGSVCNTDEDCKPLQVCSSCRWSLRGRLACIL
ncbi:fruit-specific protein-like [Lycium barbarum]|uniref:fruit-specific protein-like n=1 Tax=Lycium barbarum TaxID=112863 RepID=UPI00293F1E75|nr:fruit-specific protein-like [Lycium barbarum]XP_060173902.1 fruit-specific protein-like [Lycium barbarum]